MLEDFASGVSAIGGSLFLPVQNQMMEEDRNQRQQFNADQATLDRAWQEQMSNTSYQRQVADMNKAGINPMLLINKAGGASTPTGAVASTGGTAGYPSTGSAMPFFQNVASAMQARLNEAAVDKTKAEADYVRAQTGAVPVTIENTQAKTEEARASAQQLLQQVRTGAASVEQMSAQTEAIRAQIPVFDATVKNLRALTVLHGEEANLAFQKAGLTQAEGIALQQRIKEDIPKLEAALLNIKTQLAEGDLPQARAKAGAYTTPSGKPDALLEFLRALPLPFVNIVPSRNY